MLQRENIHINHKRTYRLYKEAGLTLKRRNKKNKRVDIDVAEQMLANMPQDSIGQRIQRRNLYALAEVNRILKL